jgi:long-chain acyl-CoA synthetase
VRDLGFAKSPAIIDEAIRPATRFNPKITLPVVHFDSHNGAGPLSVRDSLRGKNVLLIGATGFIGKVWLANLLTELPEIGRIYLLIRSNRSTTSLARFQRVVEESPVFEPLARFHGDKFAAFLREKIEVVDGDVTRPELGFAPDVAQKIKRSVHLIVNSSGLTDFNPDLRDALAMNVRATNSVLNFLTQCDHGALLHLSTSYVVGRRDGRVFEELPRNYTPIASPGFDAAEECARLEALIHETEARAESPEVTEEIRRMAKEKEHAAKDLQGAALENQVRKNRFRWLRQVLTEAGPTPIR